MNYTWNWRIFWETSPDGVQTYMDTLWSGLLWTLATALTAWVMALALGLIIGTIRTLPNKWLVRAANGYVELFRNVPLLVQMFLWYFVMPEVLPQAAGDWIKSLSNGPFVTAVLCLGFFTSSRVAVQVTTGIQTLSRGQMMAGTALGLTLAQTYRYILLPMAGRVILPPLTSEFLNIMKNSSVALTIGLAELMFSTKAIYEYSFQTFEALSAATVIYVLVNLLVIVLMFVIERAVAIPGFKLPSKAGAGGH